MSKRKLITKQLLVDLGVIDVSKDGQVTTKYKGGHIKTAAKITTCHRYGKDKSYLYVNLGGTLYAVSRIVYAWFYGECPVEFDVDHIDGNAYNNSIENLRLLTRAENLRSRARNNNQYSASWTDEEYAQRQAEKSAAAKRKELREKKRELTLKKDHLYAQIRAVDKEKVKLTEELDVNVNSAPKGLLSKIYKLYVQQMKDLDEKQKSLRVEWKEAIQAIKEVK